MLKHVLQCRLNLRKIKGITILKS